MRYKNAKRGTRVAPKAEEMLRHMRGTVVARGKDADGPAIVVRWDVGVTMRYHPSWLRKVDD